MHLGQNRIFGYGAEPSILFCLILSVYRVRVLSFSCFCVIDFAIAINVSYAPSDSFTAIEYQLHGTVKCLSRTGSG